MGEPREREAEEDAAGEDREARHGLADRRAQLRHDGELDDDEARGIDQQHRRAGALDRPRRRIADREQPHGRVARRHQRLKDAGAEEHAGDRRHEAHQHGIDAAGAEVQLVVEQDHQGHRHRDRRHHDAERDQGMDRRRPPRPDPGPPGETAPAPRQAAADRPAGPVDQGARDQEDDEAEKVLVPVVRRALRAERRHPLADLRHRPIEELAPEGRAEGLGLGARRRWANSDRRASVTRFSTSSAARRACPSWRSRASTWARSASAARFSRLRPPARRRGRSPRVAPGAGSGPPPPPAAAPWPR